MSISITNASNNSLMGDKFEIDEKPIKRVPTSLFEHQHNNSITNDSISLEIKSQKMKSHSRKHHHHHKKAKANSPLKQPKRPKGVCFKKNFVEVIDVECWKLYNMENYQLPNENNRREKVKCVCTVF